MEGEGGSQACHNKYSLCTHVSGSIHCIFTKLHFIKFQNKSFNVPISGLEFAWTEYKVRVQMISEKANSSDPSLWSEPAIVTARQSAPRDCLKLIDITMLGLE